MKKQLFLGLMFSFSIFKLQAQLSEKQVAMQEPLAIEGKYLLNTQWDQWGSYAKYTPENQVLGCWSTALAQIFYYHKLQPSGTINYACSKGYQIKDTLSNYRFRWADFTPSINKSSAAKNVMAVSRYSYLTAIAIGKDFGTPKYRQLVNPGPLAEQHFPCTTTFYVCFTVDIPFSNMQLEAIAQQERIKAIVNEPQITELITTEIDQRRPVYFHMGNLGTYGHSTVIDGYQWKANQFLVHLNYGAGGFRTGWYELFKPIDVSDDMKLRAFMTVKVKSPTNKK